MKDLLGKLEAASADLLAKKDALAKASEAASAASAAYQDAVDAARGLKAELAALLDELIPGTRAR